VSENEEIALEYDEEQCNNFAEYEQGEWYDASAEQQFEPMWFPQNPPLQYFMQQPCYGFDPYGYPLPYHMPYAVPYPAPYPMPYHAPYPPAPCFYMDPNGPAPYYMNDHNPHEMSHMSYPMVNMVTSKN